jgi:CBS domain-containing protein
MKVANVLKTKGNALFTVAPDCRLSECVITMAEYDIGSIAVMEAGTLVGLLTFREVLQVLARRQVELRIGPTPPVAELRADQVMIRPPALGQRYLPVLDGHDLVGVVSYHDVMRSENEQQKFENRLLKAYIADWPEDQATQ